MNNKIIITGKIKNLTAFHTGATGANLDSDMPLVKNGAGKYYIPGTSLAGALRASAEKFMEKDAFNKLFGYQQNDQGLASLIYVEDAEIIKLSKVSIRDHLVIMRETGTAAPKMKFDEEIIQAGSLFDFRLEIDAESEKDLEIFKKTLGTIIKGLKEKEFFFGSAASRGLGRFELIEEQVYMWDFEEKNDFSDFLNFIVKGDSKCKVKNVSAWGRYKINENYLYVKFLCGIDGPFMIKDGSVDESKYLGTEAPDMTCLMEINADDDEVFIIPGSSIKGAFRTQAEKIIRMFKGDTPLDQQWIKQNTNDKGELDIKKLGNYLEQRRKNGLELKEVLDCFGGSEEGQGVFLFEDAYFKSTEYQKATKATNHVAIDPLTGGAIEGALFSMDAIWNQKMAFELGVYVKKAELWQIGLLGHLFKDLFTGHIRLGFGKTKGMGKIVFKGLPEGRMYQKDLKDEDVDLSGDLNEEKTIWLDKASQAFNKEMKVEV